MATLPMRDGRLVGAGESGGRARAAQPVPRLVPRGPRAEGGLPAARGREPRHDADRAQPPGDREAPRLRRAELVQGSLHGRGREGAPGRRRPRRGLSASIPARPSRRSSASTAGRRTIHAASQLEHRSTSSARACRRITVPSRCAGSSCTCSRRRRATPVTSTSCASRSTARPGTKAASAPSRPRPRPPRWRRPRSCGPTPCAGGSRGRPPRASAW